MTWIKTVFMVGPENRARLRSVGFDDRGILQIALLASRFSHSNRMAGALRVGRA